MTHQLEFFGGASDDDKGGRRDDSVTPAATSPVHEAAADWFDRQSAMIRFGTSTWTFPGWKGLVYADGRKQELIKGGLAAYAKHPLLRTVGVDRSFYGPVPAKTLTQWHDETPDDFRFLVKAPQFAVTPLVDRKPNPSWLDAPRAYRQFIAPMRTHLRNKVGALLLQFPPLPLDRDRSSPLHVDRVLASIGEFFADVRQIESDSAPTSSPAPLAIELRNPVVLQGDRASSIRDVLASLNVAWCFAEHPRSPDLRRQREVFEPASMPFVCARWMLRRDFGYQEAQRRFAPFDSLQAPDTGTRSFYTQLIRDALTAERDMILIANNKAEGCAPLTCFELAREVSRD